MSTAPPIRIGMLSTMAGRGSMVLAAASAARAQDAEFFFFKPEDVDASTHTINGLCFDNGDWQRRRVPFPDVVENNTTKPIAPQPWDALVQRCRITTPYLGGKAAVAEKLRASGRFGDLLIPTELVQSPAAVFELVVRHQAVVVKPEFGNRGRGILYIAEQGRDYHVNADGEDHQLSRSDLDAFLAPRLGSERHVGQEYVASRTALDQPFDIRIHHRRDGNGYWRLVYSIARIGTGTSVAANVATGGSLAEIRPFAKHNFGKSAGDLLTRLRDIAVQFPHDFQALYPGTTIPALGIDLGVDKDGRPRLFEVNSNPSPQFAPFEDHYYRMGYAIYLVKNPDIADGVDRRTKTSVEGAKAVAVAGSL